MSISDHSARSTTFTMRRLVQALAKHIRKFYEVSQAFFGKETQSDRFGFELQEMTDPGTPRGVDQRWALERIDFDRLYLTELQHVSQGSWQPVLYYKMF
jgi:lipase chaperone LimK